MSILDRGLWGPCFSPMRDNASFEASGNQSVFRVPIWDLQNDSSSPKLLESDCKRCLEIIPKPPKYILVDPSKHMQFIVWKPLWVTWGGVVNQLLFFLFQVPTFLGY